MSRRKFNKGKLKASVKGWVQRYPDIEESEDKSGRVERLHKDSQVDQPEAVRANTCDEDVKEIGYRTARIIDGVPYLRELFGYSEKGGGLKTGRRQSENHD